MSREGEGSMRKWLEEVWREARRVVIVEGGETGEPLDQRQVLAAIEDPDLLRLLHIWTTSGSLAGGICRCLGDLTLVVYDEGGRLVGSASVHPDRLSWERSRFQDDLLATNMVELRLLFSRMGVNGTSRALLDRLISALDLHEGEIQFRPRGDFDSLAGHRVPPSLARELVNFSGEEAASLDGQRVEQLARHMFEVEKDSETVIRQLFSWLGSATWPAEAIAGDGVLARRMLGEVREELVTQSLANISDSSELMGAVVWAAFREDDAVIMNTISSAVHTLLRGAQSA